MMIIKMLPFFICPQSVDLTKRFSLYYCSGILFGELVYTSQKKSAALSKQQKYHLMVSFFSRTRNLWSGVCKDSSETRILRKSHKGHEGYLDGKVPEHCRGILQAVYTAEHRNTCYSYDKVKVKQLYTDLPALGHAHNFLENFNLFCYAVALYSSILLIPSTCLNPSIAKLKLIATWLLVFFSSFGQFGCSVVAISSLV